MVNTTTKYSSPQLTITVVQFYIAADLQFGKFPHLFSIIAVLTKKTKA